MQPDLHRRRETGRMVRLRYNEHLRDAKNKRRDSPWGEHFWNKHQNSQPESKSITAKILEVCRNERDRKIAESLQIRGGKLEIFWTRPRTWPRLSNFGPGPGPGPGCPILDPVGPRKYNFPKNLDPADPACQNYYSWVSYKDKTQYLSKHVQHQHLLGQLGLFKFENKPC